MDEYQDVVYDEEREYQVDLDCSRAKMVYLDDDSCEGSYFKFQKEIIKKVRIGNQK